jgi:hypothetical protein
MEKQTAVSWLVERLAKNGTIHSSDIHKANEIFEQQIMDAYETSYISMMTSEQYYNETFKSE